MPGNAEALRARAHALADAGQLEAAVDAFATYLALEPRDLATRTRLGLIQKSLGDLDAALDNLEAVLASAPHADTARLNLALALDEAGDAARALALLDSAGALLAESAEARWLCARVLLRAGDYARGFAFFESRWQVGAARGDARMTLRDYPQPLWRGEARPGARLLIWHEQGLGDTLLALRFAAAARERGLTVIAEVQPTLRELVASMPGVAETVPAGVAAAGFDFHLPALSLPHAFGLTVAAAGHHLPAIRVAQARRQKWRALLPPGKALRIGLAWRSTVYRDDLLVAQDKLAKSLPLAALAPFAALPGVELVSLQVGHGADETSRAPGMRLTDLTAHIDDMADTAALIACLDLTVSIDTSVAHLAGALGAPLFVLATREPDWRWIAGRVESPWYPHARLFRQTRRNDWRAPVAAACAAARELAAARPGASLLDRLFGVRRGG